MRFRILILSLLALACMACALAKSKPKPKLDAYALMTQSDAQYYYPAEAGVKDLAVDVTIDALAKQLAAKKASIHYYYASESRQSFIVENLNDKPLQSDIDTIMSPLADYIMPRASASTFVGCKLSAQRIFRSFLDTPDTEFYQVTATLPAGGELKEFRVLLDKGGLAKQMERVLPNGTSIIGQVANTKIGGKWQITGMTTRMPISGDPGWRIDQIEYATVNGYSLPVKATVLYRDNYNKPLKDMYDIVVTFANYRINQGIADATLPKATPAAKPDSAGK